MAKGPPDGISPDNFIEGQIQILDIWKCLKKLRNNIRETIV